MKPQRLLTTLAVLLAAETAALAQFDFFDSGPPPKPAWEQFKLNPNTRIKLDFRNASVDAVIQKLSQASGLTIIKDPALTNGLTLQSPKAQSLTDAFSMLNAVLNLKNYELVKDGSFLLIRQKQQRPQRGNFNPEEMGFGGGRSRGSQTQLKVYTIKYANASQVARVVNEVFAGMGGQQGGFPGGFGGGRFGGGGNNNFGGGGRGGRQRGGGGGQPNFNFQRGGAFGAAAATPQVRASADDFSNSVIVNASSSEHEQISKLIEQIDKQTEQPQQSRVFNLQYASATELAPVVQNVLVSNTPRGRGGLSATNIPIDQRFQQAARFGSTQAAFGQVVAETRTNSLVVTATQENLDMVAKVIEQLDKEVSFENSTFVVTLENARADVIAQLLNQSFGGRNGTGNFNNRGGGFGNFQNQNNNQNRRRNNNNRGGNNFGGGGGGGGFGGGGRAAGASDTRAADKDDSAELSLDLADPNADSGDLATNVTIQDGLTLAQFGGGGGFGGGFGGGGFQNRQQQNRQATGLDEQGRVVNVRDLTGQVLAVPDINTNSVIILTSPENRALLENILRQLDMIPEQVMIETLIVEASLDASSKLGVEWNFTSGQSSGSASFGLQADTTQPQGMRYTLTGGQYSVFLQALQSDSRFEVLSTPRIFTSNNATAEINISQSLPYVTNQRTDVNGNFIFTYDFLDVGIVLTVTPRITSNGYVTMDVTQTANDFVRYTDFNAPVVNQREAQTTVSVKDGETVVLGGVIRNSVQTTTNKIPLLGDIPLLGQLFRSTVKTKNKTELLVFLTPRVVRNEEEARKLRERTQQQLVPGTQQKLKAFIPPAQEQKAPEKGAKQPAPAPNGGQEMPAPQPPAPQAQP